MNDITSTNNTNMTLTAKPKTQFSKVITHPFFKDLLKEAKRVGYVREGKMNDFITIKDDESGEMVFRGLKMNKVNWMVTFSLKYWQEPAMMGA
jgi:hypothetical protein